MSTLRTITVERPVRAGTDRLWGFVGRVADWAALLPTIEAIEPVPDVSSPAVGARYLVTQPGLPPMTYEITVWEPGRRFTWVAAAPGVRTTGTHEVTPAPDGSVLLLTLGWTGPLAPLVRLLLTRRTQRYVRLEAATFARLAESEAD